MGGGEGMGGCVCGCVESGCVWEGVLRYVLMELGYDG